MVLHGVLHAVVLMVLHGVLHAVVLMVLHGMLHAAQHASLQLRCTAFGELPFLQVLSILIPLFTHCRSPPPHRFPGT